MSKKYIGISFQGLQAHFGNDRRIDWFESADSLETVLRNQYPDYDIHIGNSGGFVTATQAIKPQIVSIIDDVNPWIKTRSGEPYSPEAKMERAGNPYLDQGGLEENAQRYRL